VIWGAGSDGSISAGDDGDGRDVVVDVEVGAKFAVGAVVCVIVLDDDNDPAGDATAPAAATAVPPRVRLSNTPAPFLSGPSGLLVLCSADAGPAAPSFPASSGASSSPSSGPAVLVDLGCNVDPQA
jgi:pyruvate/2-oxoglutarate dehydrogenase complex dihydrolipoamide acyltransferase (E2) component